MSVEWKANGENIMCECVFCHKEQIVTDFVYEDDMVMAFMDMEPINEGHVLLVPKQHYLDADEIPDELLAHLIIVSKKIVYKETDFAKSIDDENENCNPY